MRQTTWATGARWPLRRSDRVSARGREPQLRLVGHDCEERREFVPGETLAIHASGLKPSTQHTVTLSDRQGELFTVTVMSYAAGVVDPTALWPMMGLEDPRSPEPVSIAEARRQWHGVEIELTVREGERQVARAVARLDGEHRRPLVVG